MKIVAIIPARFASTRFPGKPLALISGRPMIQHVYERVRKSQLLEIVCVATDDHRIETCVKSFGGHVILTRPDHESGTDRVYEAAKKLQLESNDLVINIQGDQPLFPAEFIGALVDPFNGDESLGMATLSNRIKDLDEVDNPNHVKVVVDRNGYALYFSRLPIPYWRDRDCEPYYYKHIGVYAYRMDFLKVFTSLPPGRLEKMEKLEQLRALEAGFKIKVVESLYDSTEVDVQEDIIRVEKILQNSAEK